MDDLTFKECVLKEFNFLISNYKFKCKKADTYYLRFESTTVFIELHYDGQRSFEIDLSLGLIADLYDGKERPFYLDELIGFSIPDGNEDYRLMQASTSEQVARFVTKLAVLTEKYATDFLLGNRFSFKALSDFREKESNQYSLETNLKDIRTAAKEAWHNKNYADVIRLYEPVKKHITQSEIKKLEYCYKKKNNLIVD